MGDEDRFSVHQITAEDVRFQENVIIEHKMVPEEGGEEELKTHAEHDDERLLIFHPDVGKTTSPTVDGLLRHGEIVII